MNKSYAYSENACCVNFSSDLSYTFFINDIIISWIEVRLRESLNPSQHTMQETWSIGYGVEGEERTNTKPTYILSFSISLSSQNATQPMGLTIVALRTRPPNMQGNLVFFGMRPLSIPIILWNIPMGREALESITTAGKKYLIALTLSVYPVLL